MLKTEVIFILVFIFLIGIANAETYQYNNSIEFKKLCLNNGTYCGASAICNVTILYPNSSTLINNQKMTNAISYHNITLSPLTTNGEYTYFLTCTDSGRSAGESGIFSITGSGKEVTTSLSILYIFIYLLFIITMIGIIGTFFLSIAKLAMTSETLTGVLTSWIFYILLIVVYYLDKTYISDSFINQNANLLLNITAWTNILLPLISFVVAFFIRITKKKKPLQVSEITGGLLRYG